MQLAMFSWGKRPYGKGIETTISVILLKHCRYNCVSLPLQQGIMLEKIFNQIDEDKAHNTMQHWIGEGGEGVSTTCVTGCVWLKSTIYLSLKIIMKFRDISKRLLKSSHTLRPILATLSLQISSLSMHWFPLWMVGPLKSIQQLKRANNNNFSFP